MCGQRGKTGEQHDDENIIHAGPGHDELGNAAARPVALIHQPQHFRHHHRGRNGGENAAQHGGLYERKAQQGGRQQRHGAYLKACGHEAHQHGGPPCAAKLGGIQAEAGARKNNEQRRLPQICRGSQQRAVQRVQHAGPQHNACGQHAQKRRKAKPFKHGGQRHAA